MKLRKLFLLEGVFNGFIIGVMKKILCVDDEKFIHSILSDFLQEGGHEVSSAKNGLDAFLMAINTQFDLILTDFQMPIMNGGGLIQSLREKDGPNKGTPVIIISAFSEPAKRCTEGLDNVHFLGKPIILDDLKSVVDKALEGLN